ncbi:universal stress protein [Kitasatospora sp. NPDC059646]|uniref:universal stress protein n=1 Tax=Kitasatospora sp. NPDC059646 TaxID=3346893 RepID=UPI0036926BA0
MSTFVLAGTDGSAESDAAVDWAADEALRGGHALRLVHAWTWEDDLHVDPDRSASVRTLAERTLADTARRVRESRPGLEVHSGFLTGREPAASLVEAAAEAELLVVGSLGLGGFEGLLVGSVGLYAAARCEVPVVLVRAGQSDGAGAAEVVVAVDAHEPADRVMDFAFGQAAARGAVLRAVHGWTPPPVWGYAGWVAPEAEAEQFRVLEAGLLDRALDVWRAKYPGVAVVADSRVGGAAGAVVAASAGAGLVVVGRRRRRLGPVAHAVVQHAQSPVVVVPHD